MRAQTLCCGLLLVSACAETWDPCQVAWEHGYTTGLEVGSACYDEPPEVTARCTQVGTGLDEEACLTCMWEGYSAGLEDGAVVCGGG